MRWLARLLAPQFFFLFFPARGLSCPHAVDTCDMRVRCVSCTVRCRVGHFTVGGHGHGPTGSIQASMLSA